MSGGPTVTVLTVIIAPVVATLVLGAGLLYRPGTPSSAISLQYGWFVALAASLGGNPIAGGDFRHSLTGVVARRR